MDKELPFCQRTLCLLESDPFNYIKFKYLCSQGSILGLLLFLIYINDIVNSSTILSFVLFADDTAVYVHIGSIDDVIQILNTELSRDASWIIPLTLNVNTTQLDDNVL